MNIPNNKVKDIMKLSQETASLDSTVDEDNATRLADLIRDEASAEPFDLVFHLTLQDTLGEVLRHLSEREMKIIKLRFGLDGEGPFTLEETGKMLGITRERVRQIQEKAMIKLRNITRIQDYHDIY
jgi:RNA polymerase primary sigma factor